MQILLSPKQLHLTILRLAHHITENYSSLENLVFIGIQPRGVKFSDRLIAAIRQIRPNEAIQYGILDITFYRDDIRDELHIANKTDISFSIENKLVVLMDDVLYTGRTTRAALDALQDFGRPEKVMLCVLVDRRFNRELPIQPDFSGKTIDTMVSQKVKVEWDREEVVVY